MTRWMETDQPRPRLTLFARTQGPFVLALLAVMTLAAPVVTGEGRHVVDFVASLVIAGVATVLAAAVPWERLDERWQIVLPLLDLVAVGALAFALHAQIDTTAVLAAFPAMWLASNFGVWGTVMGVAGTLIVSLVPHVHEGIGASPAGWVRALVPPLVVSGVVVMAAIFAGGVFRSQQQLKRALHERNEATDERERVATILRSFADEVDLGIVYCDEDGAIVLRNEPAVEVGRLARADEDGVAQKAFAADQVTPLTVDEQPLVRVRRGETVRGALIWIGPRGKQRALLVNGRPMQRADGTPAGSLLVLQDVTALVRAVRMREDALDTLAHELRTPLTSIVGYSDLLMEDLTGPAAEKVGVISRNAEHLRALTSAILDGLRDDIVLDKRELSLRRIVQQAIDDQRMAASGLDDRELVVDVPEALRVEADRGQLIGVVNNLLSNAVKYSRTGDRIEVRGEEQDATVCLTVWNSGPCIEPEELERIFDRFYRGHAHRDAVGGTGIGLAVSRRVVEAHGGTLTAEPVEEGALFRLVLPRG